MQQNFKGVDKMKPDEIKLYETAKQSCVICNSCRYCEGFCAVFPAMEKKRTFEIKDIDYLANLCHQCGECFYACQYAPPHEFNVNIPSQLGDIRVLSYKKFAYPAFLAKLFDKNGFFVSIAFILSIFAFFIFGSFLNHGNLNQQSGNFYLIMPYNWMVGIFSIVGILVFICLCMGFLRFMNSIKEDEKISFNGVLQGIYDGMSLKYLGGHNNEGCTYPDENRSNMRKIFHHFTFYGFLFCFIATCLGAFYDHFLNLVAPYPFFSLPKIFGTLGGVFLCIGTLGLFILKIKSDEKLHSLKSMGIDYAFIFNLFITSLSGLILMIFRETYGLGYLVLFHLSTILVLFIMMPYGKFIHSFYRIGALVKYSLGK